MLKQTPSQTVGPYYAYAWTPELYGRRAILSNVLATTDTPGERIRLQGTVTDGEGTPIRDCILEIWQADAEGRIQPGAAGFGRCGTTEEGVYHFDTVKPGSTGDGEAPQIAMTVFARGMLVHAFTRVYFADEERANAEDPTLAVVPADRRATLLAERTVTPGGVVYRFDVRLQGDRETVFFDL
ncbi:protocatechuate 3,4-dioxygenase subunit alpha [Azospirillum griseum]|uniref:Protocatechuate 3,4-dioxygenase subunit alpha n=1 Tax=Azospirillum griseum TaxID=2496639 RepID=A0A3S0K4F2_9PROT|nr:protocatechuate 3,4-dioxygenase subunit alpha [Azospirillum griseum]RTR20152.1 protocatechuate 3,4-dioxygenase subunit alpha [Azospirillum griseum]